MPLERRTPLGRGTKGLAPGKPLQRRTPIASGEPTKKPAQRAPLARTAPPERARAPMPRRAQKTRTPARRTGPTPETRQLVHARDGGLCVRCGGPASDLDHRLGRGAGGTSGEESARINGAAWLITLCGSGNTSGCHGEKESDRHAAERLGYRLPRNGIRQDAELVPVLTRFGWVRFDNEGGMTRTAAPADGDARTAWRAS